MNIGIKDEDFVRGKVPMTKEEIRILTLVKARIAPDAVVYYVGAGTGSISIEAARMAPQGHVYAIEKNPDGIALIAENAKKFGAENITVVEGTAPDALADLPALDAAIIGGNWQTFSTSSAHACARRGASSRMRSRCRRLQRVSIISTRIRTTILMRRCRCRSIDWSASAPTIWQRRSIPSISLRQRESEESR